MRQRHVFCIWMSKIFRTLLFLCERSHQIFCILQLGHLWNCAVGVKAQRNNKILNFCASKYKNAFRKKQNIRKKLIQYFTMHTELTKSFYLSIEINMILGVVSCHDQLRWISSYTLIFREYPSYTQACFAISWHAYRFYAHNIADMIMA